jgi:hypothetical protein
LLNVLRERTRVTGKARRGGKDGRRVVEMRRRRKEGRRQEQRAGL